MRIALIDGTKTSTLYPLPLLKIGAWRKSLGDTCQIFDGTLPPAGTFDEIWITTRFTFDIPFAVGLVREAKRRAKRVWVGGISASLLPEYFEREGVEVHRGLIPEVEAFTPDYSLLGFEPEYSITNTSRGCIRKCGFCMVTKLEPKFSDRPEWDRDIHPATTKVLFYDNNWLAKSPKSFARDVQMLHDLTSAGKITEIDFNQGLDARLVTDEIADALQGLPIKPARFAFDGKQEDGFYQRAIERMVKRGFREFMSYVLYNFMDTPQDFYYRLRESVRLSSELRVNVDSFPMCYSPILQVDAHRNYVGKHWTLEMKRGFMTIQGAHSGPAGTMTTHSHNTFPPLEEFEYWYGKDADEFVRLISYPNIRLLAARKKGALRIKRAKANTTEQTKEQSHGQS
jgi:hypothetical protein